MSTHTATEHVISEADAALRKQILEVMAVRGKDRTGCQQTYEKLKPALTADQFGTVFYQLVADINAGRETVPLPMTEDNVPGAGEGEAIQEPATPRSDKLPPLKRKPKAKKS